MATRDEPPSPLSNDFNNDDVQISGTDFGGSPRPSKALNVLGVDDTDNSGTRLGRQSPSSGLSPKLDGDDDSDMIPDYIRADEDATNAYKYEDSLSYWQTARIWHRAIAASIIASISIIGEGYDLALLGHFFSLAQFKELFGYEPEPGKAKEIPTHWQSSIQGATLVGQVVAVWLAGICIVRFGYRKTMLTALLLVMLFLLVSFFSPLAIDEGRYQSGLSMLLAGEFLLGLPWGTFQACTVAYASEIAPLKIRGTLTTFTNMCWIIGQLLSTAANKGVSSFPLEKSRQAFQIPIAAQWIWPLPLGVLLYFFVPESTWWLVRRDMQDQARKILRKLNPDPEFPIDGHVRVIALTNEKEKRQSEGISYFDCFKGTDLRRTEICVMLNLTQQLCGSNLMYYSAKMYQKGGMSVDQSFNFSLIQYGLGLCGVVGAWVLMRYIGRRTIWLSGLTFNVLLMVSIGIFGFFLESPSKEASPFPWVSAAALILFTLGFNLAIGPLTYSLASEVPSTRKKPKTMAIGRASYLITGVINLAVAPKMLEDKPNGWGLGTKCALVYAALNAIFLLWAYYRLPELGALTYGEIDAMFEHRVPARKFSTFYLEDPSPASDVKEEEAENTGSVKGEVTHTDKVVV